MLGRMVAAHRQRNVPTSGSWSEQVLDEGELLLSWNQLAEEALQKHGLGEMEEEFWGWPEKGEGGSEVQGPGIRGSCACFLVLLSFFSFYFLFIVLACTIDSVSIEKGMYLASRSQRSG